MKKNIAMKKKSLLAAAVLSTLVCPAYMGRAAAADSADAGTIKARDVVVTASRTEQEIRQTPTAVEVITQKDLERTGANTLTEALKTATDLNITQSAMGNNVSLRGMNNNQTLILVNGRRVRTEDTNDSANKYELNRVNMSDVDHIEIVRGAASALYGSDAMGGVINIITKKSKKPEITVGGDWTTHEKDGYVHAASGQQGKWAFDMDARYSDTRNWGTLGSTAQVISMGPASTYTMLTQTTNQYGKRYFFDLDGRYAIDKNKEFDIFFDYMKEDLKALSTTDHIVSSPTFNRTVLSAGYRNDFDHERWTTGVGYKGKDSRGDYEIRAYHTQFDKDQKIYYTRYTGKLHKAGDLSSSEDMTFKSTTIDGRRSYQADDKNLLTFGGEYRWEDYDSTRLTSDSSMRYAALYLQDEYTPQRNWLLIPSVRWDYNDVFGSKVTAKIGTTYNFSKNARFKANFGSAYRAPTASELYMDWTHSSYAYIQGNPNLRPETAIDYDFGFEAEKGRTSGKVSYFHNRVKDLIDYEYQGVSPTTHLYSYKYYNVEHAVIQGIEAEAKQRVGDKLTLGASYTFLDAVNSETDERLANRARHNAKLMLTYDDTAKTGLSATLWQDWLINYRYELGNDSGITHLSTTNFVINKKFHSGLSAYVGVDNIFDERNVNLFNDGRVWRGGLKYTF